VLESGALLEDEHFYIARSLLQNFIARCDLADGRLVLNGLPRHAGQARDVGALVDVQTVVELHCSAETVYERIAADTGGDRGGRTDDDPAAIVRKLEIYRARIEPLIEYYRIRSARVETVDVATTSSAESTLAELESRCGGE